MSINPLDTAMPFRDRYRNTPPQQSLPYQEWQYTQAIFSLVTHPYTLRYTVLSSSLPTLPTKTKETSCPPLNSFSFKLTKIPQLHLLPLG